MRQWPHIYASKCYEFAQHRTKHDAEIKHCFFLRDLGLLNSGSWDGYVVPKPQQQTTDQLPAAFQRNENQNDTFQVSGHTQK
jgi:hypothetical protein